MKNIILKIGGMSCSACSNGLEKYLNKQDGVKNASVNLVMAQATIEYDEKKLDKSDLDRFVKEAGFISLGEYKIEIEEKKDNSKLLLILYLVLLIILMYISMSHMIGLPTLNLLDMTKNPISYGICLLILTIPFLIYGFDIIKNGINNLIHKHPNMDSLVTIGVFASLIYSSINLILIIKGNNNLVENLYFESCAMIIYFLKLGRTIEGKSKDKAKDAIKSLVQITPQKALINKNDREIEVTIDEISKGDILICKPGMKFAVDGEVVEGESYVDESFITGESTRVKKKKGSKVLCGSINLDGYIKYKALKIGKDSTISEIVHLVIEASGTKAPIARVADIASSYFVPFVFLISIVTLLVYLILGNINDGIISFVNVLVVACPCALGLATPLAIVVSSGKCVKDGILIKSSEILENASKVDEIIFDKTGTLTYGKLKVSKIINYSDISNDEILKLVSTIERQSSHPISTAFKIYKTNYLVDEFKNIKGIGLYGEIDDKKIYLGSNKLFDLLKIKNKYSKDEEELSKNLNSIIYVIINNKVVALIGVKDIIREEIKDVIIKLNQLNKEVVMLTGDNYEVANNVGKELGIKKVIAGVLPEEKENIVREEMKKNKVMMVGDGINDSIALSISDIGVSIKGGTDIAKDTSDVILLNDDLNNIPNLINISKRTIKIIKENLFWAFFYNIIMIPIAIGLFQTLGIKMSPMYGSIFMTISSLTVLLNSLRLKK